MNQYSDSESNDSDEGLRYKTESIRYKLSKNISSSKSQKSRSRSRSPKNPVNTSKFQPVQLPSNAENPVVELVLPILQVDSKPKIIENNETNSYFGPALPPHLIKKQSTKKEVDSIIGPQLPSCLQKNPECVVTEPQKFLSKDKDDTNESLACIGPVLPPHLRKTLQNDNLSPEQSDDEVFGPLPTDAAVKSKAHIALEERALELKLNQLEPETEAGVVREEWMLELPEVKAAKFGLGPRQFRSKVGPDLSDRSSWTDTPDKKQKPQEKIDLKKVSELKASRKKDAEQERIAKKLKKNKESLLEIHQSKLKDQKKDEGPVERRPFSRDIDLQVNRFDEAQKKAVLKKAQLLDDRFSSGQSKYL